MKPTDLRLFVIKCMDRYWIHPDSLSLGSASLTLDPGLAQRFSMPAANHWIRQAAFAKSYTVEYAPIQERL